MRLPATRLKKATTLRTFITLTISLIVTAILLCSGAFYYYKTSALLKNNYQQSITKQLQLVNQQMNEQIDIIDSITPLFLSNTLILDALEPASGSAAGAETKSILEKQMAYIFFNTYLWNEDFIDSVYLFDDSGRTYSTGTPDNSGKRLSRNQLVLASISPQEPSLVCKTLSSDDSILYFARNIYSTYTGEHIATIVINVNLHEWMRYCTASLDKSWGVLLYRPDMSVVSNEDMRPYSEEVKEQIHTNPDSITFDEITFHGSTYFAATQNISKIAITSVVMAPKDSLFADLNNTLKSYLLLLTCIIIIALTLAIVISRTITKPIDNMILSINKIANGEQGNLPTLKMYHEFDIFAAAFNRMLQQIAIYYNDNFQKQLLLKNAEIQALQAQMDPHFLFNVLNTIAWKAQMTENEEIYQMVISLGELLKINTISKDKSFTKLSDEMEYVRFYIYLQQMRFEDKISIIMQIDNSLENYYIPCFCIQPLVENAIVHGLEPKKGRGSLTILVAQKDASMEISIIDDGIGFQVLPDIQSLKASREDSHTHIGLRNLDKRLSLLFGEESRLHISSVPSICTNITFLIPLRPEE